MTWTKLKQELIGRYGGGRSDNPYEELKDLNQTGSIEEYLSEFEFISSQVSRLSEEQYLGYFIGGLRPEIRRRVRTFNPINRLEAMRIARNVEIELYGEQSGRGVGGRMGRGNQGWVSNNPDRTGIGSGYNPNKMGIGVGPSVRA